MFFFCYSIMRNESDNRIEPEEKKIAAQNAKYITLFHPFVIECFSFAIRFQSKIVFPFLHHNFEVE